MSGKSTSLRRPSKAQLTIKSRRRKANPRNLSNPFPLEAEFLEETKRLAIALDTTLKTAVAANKETGKCLAIVRPTHQRSSGVTRDPYVCGRDGIHIGHCFEHLLRDYIRMDRRKHKFSRFRVPWGQMSDLQLRKFKQMPLDMGIQEILDALTKHDPAHPLQELPVHANRQGPPVTRRLKKSST